MQTSRFPLRFGQLIAGTICLLLQIHGLCQVVEENYPVDPASVEQAGVPKGEIIKGSFSDSKIFPGTWREYWVYVPVQYRPEKPACVYVNQDGIQFKAPTVFDNLIHNKEMPVTIGIFITPGIVRARDTTTALNRYNRSFEYDGLGDAYARFLLEEIIPEVEKLKTNDGKPIRLSKNGNDRAIGGGSSGAVCAFTAAWERPDAFSRVFSAVGTYVGLRGGDRYHTLIRKYEPKAIRVFLQDGSNDLNIYAGDWWKANETMERALAFSGYEVQHVWGEGAHNPKQGTAVFPQAMRWLWKDHPNPVQNGKTKNQFLADLLLPGEDWKIAGQNFGSIASAAANEAGDIFFYDAKNARNYKIPTGQATIHQKTKRPGAIYFGPQGKQYIHAAGSGKLFSYNTEGKEASAADNISSPAIVVASNGNLFAAATNDDGKTNTLLSFREGGKQKPVDENVNNIGGLALSPDQTQLYLTSPTSHWLSVSQVQPDGVLHHKQRYGWLHVPDSSDHAGARGIACDTSGRIYVATSLGIQILDQTGRVNAIVPLPGGQPSLLCFGGVGFNTLFAFTGNKVYRRKLNTRGVKSYDDPLKPARPKL